MSEKSFLNPSFAYASTIAFFIAALFNAILTVLKELNEGIHDWLAAVFGHHWVGHGILVMVVFIVVALILSYTLKVEEIDDRKTILMIILIVLGSVISTVIIGGFMWMLFTGSI
ncbi:MAG: hypothetical protein ACP6IS_05785 [Candidatus Asgardarchaeia archaeon]